MLVATSSLVLLLLFSTCINIHFVTGETGEIERSGCKANGLARTFVHKLIQNLKKQRIMARNGKIRGESAASRMSSMKKNITKTLNAVENQEGCLGGADLEVQLKMANDIMEYVELAEKIHKKITAKLNKKLHKKITAKLDALIEMEKVSHGHDYGFGKLGLLKAGIGGGLKLLGGLGGLVGAGLNGLIGGGLGGGCGGGGGGEW